MVKIPQQAATICSAIMLLLVWPGEALAQRQGNQLDNTRQTGSQGGGAAQRLGGGQNRGGFGNRPGQGGQGQGRFGNPAQQQGFVGRDAEDVRSFFQNMSNRDRRTATFDLMIENLSDMRDSRRRRQARRRQQPSVRVQLRPTFDYPRLSPQTVSLGVQDQLAAVMQQRGVSTPSVELTERTVTLRGTVVSTHERALAERLVRLEPGVSHVENLLTVESSEPIWP